MKIKVIEYLSLDNGEFAEWEMSLSEEYRYGDAAAKIHYRLQDVKFSLLVDTETGEYEILQVQANGQTLKPVEGG